MSTRSNIAIEDPKTKKVKVIYVHSDGYPYGVGKCLVDNYNNRELAELLFNHGDASYLGDTIDECSFNRWHVSTQKSYKTKDGYDHGSFCYYTKFEPVITNKEYIKYKDKHEKHAEVKMISKIGEMLKGAGFNDDNVVIQGGSAKKSN